MTPDWRDDPDWHLVERADDSPADLTDRPADQAELAQPDGWASLYAGRRIVATWSRVHHARSAPSSSQATIAVT